MTTAEAINQTVRENISYALEQFQCGIAPEEILANIHVGQADVSQALQRAAFLRDAIADGWRDADRENFLTKDGYRMVTFGHPYIWGPDGLGVDTPAVYDWAAIVAGLRRCSECKAQDVETQRAGFAVRVCETCLPSAQERYEYPGWTN